MTEFATPQDIDAIRQSTMQELVALGIATAGMHELHDTYIHSARITEFGRGFFTSEALETVFQKGDVLDAMLQAKDPERKAQERSRLLAVSDPDTTALVFFADCFSSTSSRYRVPFGLSRLNDTSEPLTIEQNRQTGKEAAKQYHHFVTEGERYEQLAAAAEHSPLARDVKAVYDSLKKWPEADVAKAFIRDVFPQFSRLPEHLGYYIMANSYLRLDAGYLPPAERRAAKQQIIDFVNASEATDVSIVPALDRLNHLFAETNLDLSMFTPDQVADSLSDLDAKEKYDTARIGAIRRLLSGSIDPENLPKDDHTANNYLRLVQTTDDLNNLRICDEAGLFHSKPDESKSILGLLRTPDHVKNTADFLEGLSTEARTMAAELFQYFANTRSTPSYSGQSHQEHRSDRVLADIFSLGDERALLQIYEKIQRVKSLKIGDSGFYLPDNVNPLEVIDHLLSDEIQPFYAISVWSVDSELKKEVLSKIGTPEFLVDASRLKQAYEIPMFGNALMWEMRLGLLSSQQYETALKIVPNLRSINFGAITNFLTGHEDRLSPEDREYCERVYSACTDERFSALWVMRDGTKAGNALVGVYDVMTEAEKDAASVRLNRAMDSPLLSLFIEREIYSGKFLEAVFAGDEQVAELEGKLRQLNEHTKYLSFFESDDPMHRIFLLQSIERVLGADDVVEAARRYDAIAVVDAADPWRTYYEASKLLVGDVEMIGFQMGMYVSHIPKIVLPLGSGLGRDDSVLFDEYMHIGFARKNWSAMSVQHKRSLADLSGLDDSQVAAMESVQFSALRPIVKQQFLAARLYETVMFSRDSQMRELADRRNRFAAEQYVIGPEDLAHYTSVDNLTVLLPGGNLAGEVLSTRAKPDSYPFNVDFAAATPAVLTKKSHADRLAAFGSNNFGNRGQYGMEGRVVLHYKLDKDSMYADEAFNGKSFGGHKLIFGGVPTTEIRAISVLSPIALDDAVDAVVQNGVYIPIYNNDGELVFSPDTYDQRRKLFVEKRLAQVVNVDNAFGEQGRAAKTHELIVRLSAQSPELERAFAMPAGVWEGYTLGQHVEMVLNQYEKYFASSDTDSKVFTEEQMVAMLVLHDIGKPESAAEFGTTSMQHVYTKRAINTIGEVLGLSNGKKRLAMDVAAQDTFGEILNGKVSLPRATFRIKSLARKHKVPLGELMDILYTYSICDGSSYSRAASYTVGGKQVQGKTSHFEASFDRSDNRLRYVGEARQKIATLFGSLGLRYPVHLE